MSYPFAFISGNSADFKVRLSLENLRKATARPESLHQDFNRVVALASLMGKLPWPTRSRPQRTACRATRLTPSASMWLSPPACPALPGRTDALQCSAPPQDEYWISCVALLSRARALEDILLLRMPCRRTLAGGPPRHLRDVYASFAAAEMRTLEELDQLTSPGPRTRTPSNLGDAPAARPQGSGSYRLPKTDPPHRALATCILSCISRAPPPVLLRRHKRAR